MYRGSRASGPRRPVGPPSLSTRRKASLGPPAHARPRRHLARPRTFAHTRADTALGLGSAYAIRAYNLTPGAPGHNLTPGAPGHNLTPGAPGHNLTRGTPGH